MKIITVLYYMSSSGMFIHMHTHACIKYSKFDPPVLHKEYVVSREWTSGADALLVNRAFLTSLRAGESGNICYFCSGRKLWVCFGFPQAVCIISGFDYILPR